MAESAGRQYQKLPPGWDCKYDQTTGNCYYINYITKAMQLEDPRSRYRPLQNERCSNESIAMQSFHGPGGSPYHVYPSNNMPAIRAFQTPNTSLHHMSTSPLLATSRTQLINDTSPLPAPKSQLPQAAQLSRTVNMSRRSTIQETSFSNQIDTDVVVQKIQNMFPTASENHIRLLLKKYYNREAVVISALQVEKHPVTMPGPYVTPPAQRHLFHSNSAIYMTPPSRRFDTSAHLRGLEYGNYSRTASPVPPGRLGSVVSVNSGGHGIMGHMALPPYQISPRFGDQMRSSPKPHSSPKMKLRYMKTIFPKADETLLLDVLANADNNVQKASEKLIALGYVKKDFAPPPKLMNRPQFDLAEYAKHAAEDEVNKRMSLRPKEYTEEEKELIKQNLKEKYPQIVERIILMALESVNYAEDRAVQILQIVQDEEELQMKKLSQRNSNTTTEYEREQLDVVDNISGHIKRSKSSILKSSEVIATRKEITINEKPQIIDNKTDTINTTEDNNSDRMPSLRASLKLSSSVTISTKSILDRYRTNNNKINVNNYIRGTCPSTTVLDKLSAHSRDKSDSLKHSHRDYGDVSTDKLCKDFKSLMGRIQTNGANGSLAKGANEGLLLADYVTWNGANPDFYQGQRNLAIGPDASLRSERFYKPFGHNSDLCKGSKAGLAKGSIYAQQNAARNKTIDIICN